MCSTNIDRYTVQDRVFRAMMRALKEAGVNLPYRQGRMNVQIDTDEPGFDSPPKEKPQT